MVGKVARYLANNALGVLALFVALGGVSYAATGGFVSGGQLKACVNEEGAVKLLKSGKHCKHGQKAVSWNQTGPRGSSGAPGAPGVAGPMGLTGASGQPSNLMWAQIDREGVIEAGHGVSGVEVDEESPHFTVTFERPVDRCAVVATTNENVINDSVTDVEIESNTVRVYIEKPKTEFRINAGFSIIAVC